MNPDKSLHPTFVAETTGDLVRVIEALREDLNRNPDNWENPSLDRYLEALSAWIADTSSVCKDPVFIADALRAARIYE